MFGIPIKYLIVGVLALVVVGAAFKYRADLIEYGGALYAAKANAAAVKALEADAKRAAEIVAEREAKIAELEGRKAEIVKEIVRVPVTTQCVSSPAIGAVLDGMRRWSAEPGVGAAKGAGKPDKPVPTAPRSR